MVTKLIVALATHCSVEQTSPKSRTVLMALVGQHGTVESGLRCLIENAK